MSERYPGGFVTQTPPTPSVASAQGIWTLDQALQNIRAGTWPYPPQPDAQWNYVTALFAGTSTSGAQNNTFLDSSSNGFTITRNGNTTQGSFSPYQTNGYWSNYFDGTGDYLSVADNAALDFGSSDFTLEAWVYAPVAPSSDERIFKKFASNTGYGLFFNTSETVRFIVRNSGGTNEVDLTTGSVIVVGVWQHIAVTRSGNSWNLWVNGVSQASTTNSASVIDDAGSLTIGGGDVDFEGYISNARIVKGTAVYTAAFTPPTSPLTAITNTSLLTCQSNRFIDNSASPLTITVNGNTSVQDFSPLGVTTPYSPQTIGGSGYFDGSGDYLTAPSDTAFAAPGDFTFECWAYTTTSASSQCLYLVNANDGLIIYTQSNKVIIRNFNGSNLVTSSIDMPLNQWVHIAAVRSGTTLSLFLNGSRANGGTTTNSTSFAQGQAIIGTNESNTIPFLGYIAGLRFVKGTAVYDPTSSTLTVPTSPVTAITNTSLLLNFTNAGIFDAAAANNAETVGNAQVSTTVMKYGPSMLFDGSGDSLVAPSNQIYAFGTGNFTFECWLYINALPGGVAGIFDTGTGVNASRFSVVLYSSGKIYVDNDTNLLISNASLSVGQWYHIAVARTGTGTNQTRIFINGNLDVSGTVSTNFSSSNCRVGQTIDNFSLNGYLYNVRVTKGYARYWYPFTPPLVPMGTYYAPEVLPAADPLFEYVTMLLPGNGTNGAQNNTFTDSSTNNFTITRNGNTTQGTFSPYGSNWSNYFDGSGDYLSCGAANQTSSTFTGDFTIEAWFNFSSIAADCAIVFCLEAGGPELGWNFRWRQASSGFRFFSTSVGTFDFSYTPTVGVWTHVALSRSGTSLRCFVDGTQIGTTQTASGTVSRSTTNPLQVGGGVYNATSTNGYLSNVRIVNGTAVYTAAFTPPTAPLTAITNTSLLTCQSNRFIDNSTNAFAITVNGNTSVQRFSPFAPTAAYSAATIGGSGYFDGTGDYLNGPNTGQFAPTGDFTISMWFYPTSFAASYYVLAGSWNTGTSDEWLIQYDNTGAIRFLTTTDSTFSAAGVVKLNQWQFLTVSRSGNTVTGYINGTSFRSYTLTGTVGSATKTVYVGIQAGTTWPYVGWISDYRLVSGSAQSETPPTSPATAISGTNTLLSFTNGGIIDNAMMNDLETVGNAQISTTQSKFGGSSMYFDGTGDGLTLNAGGQNFAFGTGDFTIEMWVYPSTSSQSGIIYDSRPTSTSGLYPTIRLDSGTLKFYTGGASQITGGTLSANTWYHITVCRSGTSTRLFIDGAQSGSTYTDSNSYINGAARPLIGADGFDNYTGSNYFNGYIDDLRITKGIARYVQNFTPPTQAFQTS